MILMARGLSGRGLAAGLAAYKPVVTGLSAVSLALAHLLVWRHGWGGRATKIMLWLSTLAAPILWFLPLHID
jgi:hypothetical protein